MSCAEIESARDIIKDIQELAAKMKQPNRGPFLLHVPDAYAKYAADLYADQNVIVQSNNGSIYQCGIQIKQPGTHIDVRRLNEKIAAMELPICCRRINSFPPEVRKAHLVGEWVISEEGE